MTLGPYFSVVGIDPSLTATGVAFIEASDGEVSYDTITLGRKGKATDTLSQRRARIIDLVDEIVTFVTRLDPHPDVVTIESPAHGQTTGSHHDRSGLWWQIVIRLQEEGLDVVEVAPTQLKKYATGKGNAGKSEVMAAAIRRYLEAPIENDNEADAFVLAAMAARLIGEPIEASLPKLNLDAMEKVNRE